jgi:predicted DCC family thiol-disulfide oxidoreductase YuxK
MSPSSTVIYDGDCGFCRLCRRSVERLDFLRRMRWLPMRSPEANRFGVPQASLERRMYLLRGGRHWSGFAAVKQILLRLPVFYVFVGLAASFSSWSVPAILLLLSPVFASVGERLYDWVAHNRGRLPGSTCERQL